MKKFLDRVFIFKQMFLIARKRYLLVIDNCEKRTKKTGRNYASEYTLLHNYYYKHDYEKSFESFFWLLSNNNLKNDTIEWGIKLFVETPVGYLKDYQLGLRRMNKLLEYTDLNDLYKKKFYKICDYIKSKTGEQTKPPVHGREVEP